MQTQYEFKNQGETVTFKRLSPSDKDSLAAYFKQLSAETRQRYGPHPLDNKYAYKLCELSEHEMQQYWVAYATNKIIAYFILLKDFPDYENERYKGYGIDITPGVDMQFAPSIADEYQNNGLASQLMKYVLLIANEWSIRNVTLLGGVQADNDRAVCFYKKFGFEYVGEYFFPHRNLDMMLTLKR